MSNELVKSVHIQNYKSVVDLTLELGAFNVLIGENGCGKSNILEALAFGAAASADKLDHEFLGSRGIRVSSPEFMYSAFGKRNDDEICIEYWSDNGFIDHYFYSLLNDPDNLKKWISLPSHSIVGEVAEQLVLSAIGKDGGIIEHELNKVFRSNDSMIQLFKKYWNEILTLFKDKGMAEPSIPVLVDFVLREYVGERYSSPVISNFILYAPEQSSLRKFEETNQIYPLGIKGEGLFQYLKDLGLNEKNSEVLNEIKNNLTLLDWYEKFELPENSLSNDFSLNIKDKYLNSELQYFDQRSTNEGFLYLLFYSTLFLSKDTPAFFAIDNIDSSLNPKLCMQLTRNLVELAKKTGKQVIVTTQNPAILDGLNLEDDNQRLFVVRRNEDGHTKASRVEYKSERRMKLSEVWTSGFIGGLPDNF